MADMIAGPGQGLPPPQALYPPQLYATPYTAPTNRFQLSPGNSLLVPPGTWIAEGGDISRLQWKDPVDQQWNNLIRSPGIPDPTRHWGTTLRSDGFNYRLQNISGVALGATVSNGGSGYLSGNTLVTPSAGNSNWTAVVGGQLGAVTIVDGGANYSLPPIVFVPAPPYPGHGATGVAILSGGAVTGITWIDPGAGYTFPPAIVLVTDPFDPVQLAAVSNPATAAVIRPARATVALTGAGAVTAVLLNYFGQALATAPTLTITGSGSGATAALVPTSWVAPANDELTLQPSSGP
jgi:hypothetical protein